MWRCRQPPTQKYLRRIERPGGLEVRRHAVVNNALPPENIQRDAERALPKVEALLAEAAKHIEKGFVRRPHSI